ncbi:MAG: DUF6713 family protein [Myxococcota bacterium]
MTDGQRKRESGTGRRVRNLAFYLGMGFLFTHELDAVPNHEWRQLPLLQSLPDETGMWVFIAAHVPLFALLIALVASPNVRLRRNARRVIGAFLVVHGVLHGLLMGRPGYEFASTLSSVLIFGGAASGALFLALEARHRTAK